MNVEEFQLHLSNVSNLLRPAGSTKVADELDEFCAGLQPYRERRVKDLLAMITDADVIIRTGKSESKPARKSKKATPQQIAEGIGRVRDLYIRATDVAVSREVVELACKELEDLDAPKAALEALARELLITEKPKTKAVAIAKIQEAILIRKGTYQRSQI